MTFSWSHCCFLSLPFMVSEIIHREDECCTSRANKILIKRYLWTEEGHAVKCQISWNLKKKHLSRHNRLNYGSIIVQPNQCAIPHSTSCIYSIVIYASMLVYPHVNQLCGGCLQGFMVKSSCGFDKGFRAALILQLSKQHQKRRHTGSPGRVCCYVSSGPFWSKHPWCNTDDWC